RLSRSGPFNIPPAQHSRQQSERVSAVGTGEDNVAGVRRRRHREEAAAVGRRSVQPLRGGGGSRPHLGATGGDAAAHPVLAPAAVGNPHGGALPRLARPLEAPLAGRRQRRRLPPPPPPSLLLPVVQETARVPRAAPVPGAARAPRPVLARRRHNPAMGARQFGRYLDAAARCGVEDLRVELPEKPPSPDTPTKATTLRFPFPAAAGPALARLSLRGIGVSGLHSRAARPCSALEVVRLHSVPVDDRGLARMLALCPRIRVLGLHSCSALRRIAVTAATGRKLSSVTIAGCSWLIEVDVAAVSSLRSFRYTGGFLSSFYLPDNAAFADLYICFDAQRSCNVRICQKVFSDWFESRVCSKLTALTICSNVLFVCASLLDFDLICGI
uniref:At1g61320/AtMIF1 LRR domain-containing protein n=1 Tax=Aegilops tauschii subsp. strangulata TaxID=200361 RepID=A0A453CXB0_AEGTS